MRTAIAAVAAALIAGLLYASVLRIPEGSVGIAGEGVSATVLGPGLHLHPPFASHPAILPLSPPAANGDAEITLADGIGYRVSFDLSARLDPAQALDFHRLLGGRPAPEMFRETGVQALRAAAPAHRAEDLAGGALETDAARLAAGALRTAGLKDVTLKLRPLSPPEMLKLAQALAPVRRAGMLKAAAEAVEAASPGSWEISTVLGLALESDRDPRGAEKRYLDALTINPSALPPMAQLVALYAAVGEFGKLDRLLEAALQGAPTSAQHVNWLALSKMKQGDLAAAEGWLSRALAIEPDNVLLLNNLGGLRLKQQRIAEAVDLFRRAVESSPGNRQSLYNLGVALSAHGDYAEGLRNLLAAESAGGASAQLLEAIALACRKTGDTKTAEAYERRARGMREAGGAPPSRAPSEY